MKYSTKCAAGANEIIQHYRARTNSDLEDVVSDLLADLMHWCEGRDDIDFDAELDRAQRHYVEEISGDCTEVLDV